MEEAKIKRSALKQRRKALGLTQEAVAEAVGISRPYYIRLESGIREGTLPVWKRIAEVVGYPLEDIAELMYK